MTYSKKRGLASYGEVAVSSDVAYASPHRLVQMLMEGALDKIATAKGHIERGEHDGKSRHITWAVSIINGLRSALDMEQGGEIANNLNDLYDYMTRRLMEAVVSNDTEILDEVSSLLTEIKGAWDALPDSVKSPSVAARESRPAVG
ncbi:MAG TPA: flagellar export chaperone FliS [Chromatiales bacterium]|nr:flagellar export chaperone FliS [Chromatiales bacterium]